MDCVNGKIAVTPSGRTLRDISSKVKDCITDRSINAVELSYNVMKRTEYFVSLQASVVLTEEYNVRVKSEGLIGTAECLTLQTMCRLYFLLRQLLIWNVTCQYCE